MNSDMFGFFQAENTHIETELKKYLTQLIAEMFQVAHVFSAQSPILLQNAIQETTSMEFSTAGENAFRGIYSPSLICPYIVTNYRKGRILKSNAMSGTFFSYCFDNNHRLIKIDFYSKNRLQTTEYIIRNIPDIEYGLIYDQHSFLIVANRARYDENGRIVEFFESKMPLINGGNLFDYEKYYYDDKGSLEGADKVLNGIYPTCFRYCRYAVAKKDRKTMLLPVSNLLVTFEK